MILIPPEPVVWGRAFGPVSDQSPLNRRRLRFGLPCFLSFVPFKSESLLLIEARQDVSKVFVFSSSYTEQERCNVFKTGIVYLCTSISNR
jgi:hypothetical protein